MTRRMRFLGAGVAVLLGAWAVSLLFSAPIVKAQGAAWDQGGWWPADGAFRCHSVVDAARNGLRLRTFELPSEVGTVDPAQVRTLTSPPFRLAENEISSRDVDALDLACGGKRTARTAGMVLILVPATLLAAVSLYPARTPAGGRSPKARENQEAAIE